MRLKADLILRGSRGQEKKNVLFKRWSFELIILNTGRVVIN